MTEVKSQHDQHMDILDLIREENDIPKWNCRTQSNWVRKAGIKLHSMGA